MIDSQVKRANLSTHTSSIRDGHDWHAYVLTFAIAFVFLFLTTDRTLNIYDTGISLTAGFRVLAGQVPYRDFYFIYGPAIPYILAGLFRLFGTTVFITLLFDLLLKALLCASFFDVVRRFCTYRIAVGFTVLLLLWIYVLQFQLSAVTPVSLFSLWTVSTSLPVFFRAASLKRFFTAGVFAALTASFRHDAGIALIVILLLMVPIAAALRSRSPELQELRPVASAFALCMGFAVVVVPLLILYLHIAPWHDLYFDLVYYPEHYFRASRKLPLHRPDFNIFGQLTMLVPGVTVVLTAIAVVRLWWKRTDRGHLTPELCSFIGCLMSFGLLTLAMYLKSWVRIGLGQNYLAFVPTLILVAVLLGHRAESGRIFRGVVNLVAFFCVLSTARFTEQTVRANIGQKDMLVAELLRPQSQAPLPPDRDWCDLKSPATEYVCFLVNPDHVHAIEFLRSNTQPGDTIYVGLPHHDKIILNDNLTYFITGLLPATGWSHMDPHLQNTVPVQQQMVADLTTNHPRYIMLDGEFEGICEPNDSCISSHVTLLDDFIRQHYTPVRSFGTLTVLERE